MTRGLDLVARLRECDPSEYLQEEAASCIEAHLRTRSPPSSAGEREAFEAWAEREKLSLTRSGEGSNFYWSGITRIAHLAWQARAAMGEARKGLTEEER